MLLDLGNGVCITWSHAVVNKIIGDWDLSMVCKTSKLKVSDKVTSSQ